MITCEFEDGGKAKLRHAVIDTLVIQGSQVLMVKRSPKLLEGGKWGIVGGYVDLDETLTQAAEREIMEETGYTIKNLQLLNINDNPNRPKEDRQNISFVYFCDAVAKVGEPDWESTEQKWFDLNDLPEEEMIAFDHADCIKLYKKYLDENFPLPYSA